MAWLVLIGVAGCAGPSFRAGVGPTVTSDGRFGGEAAVVFGGTSQVLQADGPHKRVRFADVAVFIQGAWLQEDGAVVAVGVSSAANWSPRPTTPALREAASHEGIGFRLESSVSGTMESTSSSQLRAGLTIGRGWIEFPGCQPACNASGCPECEGTRLMNRLYGIELAWTGVDYTTEGDAWWRISLAGTAVYSGLRTDYSYRH